MAQVRQGLDDEDKSLFLNAFAIAQVRKELDDEDRTKFCL
jgi:hypothetical protein